MLRKTRQQALDPFCRSKNGWGREVKREQLCLTHTSCFSLLEHLTQVAGLLQLPQITGIEIEGLYLENEAEAGVVDQFVQSLAESPLFAITPENKDSIVEVRAAQSGSHWGYEYKLIVPLKRPIPL